MKAGWSTRLKVQRLNQGKPLIAADPESWDDGFTLNPTAIYLERSPENDGIVQGLLGFHPSEDPRSENGVVAVLYRGVPQQKDDKPALRSAVGLAVFTPELELLKRFPQPILLPTDDPMGCDYNGVEDQRVTKIGDTFYMVYCGYNPRLSRVHNIHVCMAESKDLIHWTKLGPVSGSVNDFPNKDAVIFPEPVEGKYVMLHRPCVGWQGSLSIALAVADSPTGVWKDLGTIIRPMRHPRYSTSWVGAGSAPLPLGNNRFLVDYHTGNYYSAGERDYFASYAILDFNKFDIDRPESVVESRCEGILEPETDYECNSPWPHDKTLNCVFPCGSYEYEGDIVMIYGGADAYVLGARLNKQELVSHLDNLGTSKMPSADPFPLQIKSKAPRHPSGAELQSPHIPVILNDDTLQ